MADWLLFREAGAGVRKIAARLVLDGVDEVFVQKSELTNSSGAEVGTAQDPLVVDSRSLGTWGYKAGASGSPTLTGKRVLAIYASAPSDADGSLVINGGDSIPVPAGKGINIEPRGVLTAPTIVFTGTDGYFVETIG